ncbi:hypothetical protein BN946_scf184986.g8 [Trametes cinnabarina]|uniref:F-box domain-containing protein n=1 Tax=Pycnoporus cinnabarinus TaxID=5643 RepID=A0A060SQJ6_PYCCI|nr:hypothetical protein BN946_scf184986.g8 [Trametes cinnabarina]
MIVEAVFDIYCPSESWVVDLTTVCKALNPHAEAILYNGVELISSRMAKAYLRSVVNPMRPHRAAAVRMLGVHVRTAKSIVQPFKLAFPKFTNLFRLAITSNTVELFEALLTAPPYIRILIVAGEHYPPRFPDILAAQSQIDTMHIRFMVCGEFANPRRRSKIPPLADGTVLPNLQNLLLDADAFHPTLFTHAYSITSLTLVNPSHEHRTYALKLFRETLVSFAVYEDIELECPPRCFWPTWTLHDIHLPKLGVLEVHQNLDEVVYMEGSLFEFPVVDVMTVPGLRESCPMLRTIIWGVDDPALMILYDNPEEDVPGPIRLYLRMLLDTFPHFVRLVVYDRVDTPDVTGKPFFGDIWTRENKDNVAPDRGIVDVGRWRREALGELHVTWLFLPSLMILDTCSSCRS